MAVAASCLRRDICLEWIVEQTLGVVVQQSHKFILRPRAESYSFRANSSLIIQNQAYATVRYALCAECFEEEKCLASRRLPTADKSADMRRAMSLLYLPLAIANALTARLNDGVPLVDEFLVLLGYCVFTGEEYFTVHHGMYFADNSERSLNIDDAYLGCGIGALA
ncbi:hypothetical protein GOBAR_DD00369 [Gossypium barbadense]|nr:hypothetical protein GOBAR_DD00369 [Gossypium barbadense]